MLRIEGYRLQPVQHQPQNRWALAPEGSLSDWISPKPSAKPPTTKTHCATGLHSRKTRKGPRFLPTSKQICSGENCPCRPSKGSRPAESAPASTPSAACRLFQSTPIRGINQPVRVHTHRPQAQHRARSPEYPNRGSESTKSPASKAMFHTAPPIPLPFTARMARCSLALL